MRRLIMRIVVVMVLAFAAQSQAVGTGTLDKTSNWYPAGTNLAVTASPGLNSEFDRWSNDTNDAIIAGTQISFTVDRPRSLTAEFSLIDYTLKYLAGADGSISGTATQTVEYGNSGSQVEAIANTGYHFAGWSDSSQQNPRTDTGVTNDITVTASFAINEYTVEYLADANGSISGSTNQTIQHGSSAMQVTAVPNAGYDFDRWSDGVLTAARTDAGVTNHISVTANFAIQTFTLTVNTAHGTSSETGSSPYNWGTEVTASIIDSPVELSGTTQYVCNGWIATGSAPASGTETNTSFTITNDTTITWQWSTNYWVELGVQGN